MKKLILRLALSAAVLLVLLLGTEFVLRGQGWGSIPSVWFDPEVGTRFHPSQTRDIYAAGNRYMHSAEINALGLRGDGPREADDGAGPLRVVCLGDSFTFGWGVEDDQTYPVQLEALLAAKGERSVQVINCGLPGYNTFQEHQLYKKVMRPISPDVVVVGWYLNDLDPLSIGTTGTLAELDHPLAGTALLDYYVRKLNPPKPKFRFEGFDQEAAQAIKPFYDKNRDLIEHNSGHPDARVYVERNLADLSALLDSIEADGARPVLVIFPSSAQVDALRGFRAEGDPDKLAAKWAIIARIQADLTELATGRGVTVVDLLEPYMDSEERPYGEIDLSHPSVAGYRIAAEAVAAVL